MSNRRPELMGLSFPALEVFGVRTLVQIPPGGEHVFSANRIQPDRLNAQPYNPSVALKGRVSERRLPAGSGVAQARSAVTYS